MARRTDVGVDDGLGGHQVVMLQDRSRSPRCNWWPSGSCWAASGCVARGSCSAPGGPCVLLGAGVTEGPAARCVSTRSRSMRARMCARAIDEAVVDDHAERLGEGVRFPAVSFRDGSHCCLADISTGPLRGDGCRVGALAGRRGRRRVGGHLRRNGRFCRASRRPGPRKPSPADEDACSHQK